MWQFPGAPKKDFLGKSVGHMVERSMSERCPFVTDQPDHGSIVAEDRGEPTYRFNSELVMPIISQGDPIGAVVVCGADGLEEADRKVAQSAAGVLARQMLQ